MLLPRRAFGYPSTQQLNLLRNKLLASLDWRHHFLCVARTDARDQLALARIAGHNGKTTVFEGLERLFLAVEAQFGLASAFVRAVTQKTVFRQDGTDIVVEIHLGRRRGNLSGRSSRADQNRRSHAQYPSQTPDPNSAEAPE